MSWRSFILAIGLMIPAFIGCGKSTTPVSPSPPVTKEASLTPVQPDKNTAAVPSVALKETPQRPIDPVADFLMEDSFCRDVLLQKPLAEILAEIPKAKKDFAQSISSIGYAVYREGEFMYEFLDDELFEIRYLLARNSESATRTIEPFERVLGPPTNTQMPEDFRRLKATKFLSWDLPDYNLRINFAYLKSQFADVELDLFGQFIKMDRAEEFLSRRSNRGGSPSGNQPAPQNEKPSRTQQYIQNQIADATWGEVAATVNRLCAGKLTDDEIHLHILKTIELARKGNFTPKFTVESLKKGEAEARRLQLSPVTAVISCQQSLAYGGVSPKP